MQEVVNNFKSAKLGPKILFILVIMLISGGLVALAFCSSIVAKFFLFFIVGLIVFAASIFILHCLICFLCDLFNYVIRGYRTKGNMFVQWFEKE